MRPDGVTYYDRDTDEDNHQPAASIKGTACDGQTNPPGHWRNSAFDPTISSVGYWQYTQKIKVFDTIPPEILPGLFDPFCSLDDGDCEGQVDIPLAIEENCTPEDLTIAAFFQAFNQPVAPTPDNDISGEVLTGTYPDYLISGAFPVGDHSFRIMVEDGCGQTNQLDIPFTVADCLAPTPICNNSLSISLMPLPPGEDVNGDGNPDVGAATIWAEDFITGVSSDCSGPVTYSINRPGDDPDPDQAGLIVTCADQGGLIVEIHTWDATGNNDFCLTSIFVQENLTGLCSGGGLGSATVAGGIETPDNDQVEGVEVMLSGQQSGSAVSDDQGTYIFPSIVVGQDYTLTPQFDGDWINGVSTIDIVKILKHILGVEALEGPYHMIAADANRSETITTLDVIKLRKLILGIDEEIPENTSWRFIDADYVFPDPNDPWLEDFPEVININNLQGPLVDADFQAIKVGDVNFNAATQSLASADERNFHGAFYLEVEDLDLQAGQTYPVMFRASDLTNIQGFQGSLAFDPEALDFVDMAYGLAQPGHFGYRFLDEGAITMSWNADFDEAFAPADMPLFTVHFRAKTDAALPELLEINSAFTPAEAYDGSEERLTLAIDFQKKRPLADEFRLFPNRPNPFREATVISFYLPEESAAVRLCIYTIEGRLLREVRGDFGAGYQEIELTAAGLSAAGLLYYTLETDVHFDSGKMIFLR